MLTMMNITTTTHVQEYTLMPAHSVHAHNDVAAGFVSCAVAVVFFGSNFLPVKKFETGDGVFYQWVMCGAIWLTGLVVQAIRHSPPFYPLAMLGGFLWATGNIVVVPIIQTVGLSQGLLVWASFNLITGWATGRYGFLGTTPQVPHNITLNYIGMALCFCSAFLYTMLKTNVGGPEPEGRRPGSEEEDSPLLAGHTQSEVLYSEPLNDLPPDSDSQVDVNLLNKLQPKARRICALCLAVLAGLLFGANFTPVIYIQDHYVVNNVTASQHGLDYVFAHFSGIYATSTVYFVLYCAVMRNRPRVYPRAILPAFISGLMWAVADSAWFIANAELSEPVAFPIISSVPGMIATLWGMCLFKEISGKRNVIILCVAFTTTTTGAVLTGLSRLHVL